MPSTPGYICKRISETRIVVISESLTSQPLPANVRGVCKIPVRIPDAAVQSSARIVGLDLECVDASARPIACSVKDGLVRIAGPAPKPTPEPKPEFADVFVLLSNAQGAPTVKQLAAFDFSSDKAPPLRSLEQFRPLAAYSLMHERASGAALRYLQRNPETSRARLERYVVLRFPLSTPIREAFAEIERDAYVQHIHYPTKLSFASEIGRLAWRSWRLVCCCWVVLLFGGLGEASGLVTRNPLPGTRRNPSRDYRAGIGQRLGDQYRKP